jgi:hypothetical protein
MNTLVKLVSVGAMLLCLGGCGLSYVVRNTDPALRRESEEFAADAAHRFPFRDDAPAANETVAQAEVNYGLFDQINLTNTSDADLQNVEVWINKNYVVYLPVIEKKTNKRISFDMLYDNSGHHFKVNEEQPMVKSIQLLADGKVYEVPVHLAD